MHPIPLPADERVGLLRDWLAGLRTPYGLVPETLSVASSDASFRRYFRVDASPSLGHSLIVMDAPPPQEDCSPFVHAAREFGLSGITVPRVIEADLDRGLLLLEDFGTVTYASELNAATAPALYGDALKALVTLQQHTRADAFPPYDRARLLSELELFPQWYVARHLNARLSEQEEQDLQGVFNLLIAAARAQPQVAVHRDFHCRNLMVLPGSRNPGVLDFQDAVLGPITYDLVSLLRDAYLRWDEEQVLDWAIRYWERARKAGLPVASDFAEFYRDFEWMGLQRHLKVLGIFARLYHRDGKDHYLADLPRVMQYVREAASRYLAMTPLIRLLDRLEGRSPQVGHTF